MGAVGSDGPGAGGADPRGVAGEPETPADAGGNGRDETEDVQAGLPHGLPEISRNVTAERRSESPSKTFFSF